MKALLFVLLSIVTFGVSAQITIPRTIINSYTLEAVASLTAETNGKSLPVTRNETVFTIHGVNLADRITLHSPGLKSISLSQPFGEETLFMEPTDSMRQEYHKTYPFYQPIEKTGVSLTDETPEFPGGITGLRNYLRNELNYPKNALELSVQGKVYMQFVVEADGTIGDIAVIKGVCLSIDQESVRVIRNMPKWIPATVEEKAMRSVFNLPINYTLQ